MKRGFTLVEFLIVIGILSLSVGSILLILTTVIKGANQTNVLGEVKQNGQSVLDTVTGQIRNAVEVYPLDNATILGYPVAKPAEAESGVWVWTASGEKLTIICVNNSGTTSNGRIMINVAPASAVRTETNIANFTSISNADTKTGVDIDCGSVTPAAGAFVVSSTVAGPKVVFINFVANQGVEAPSRADFNANAQFKTAISLRKYQ